MSFVEIIRYKFLGSIRLLIQYFLMLLNFMYRFLKNEKNLISLLVRG